MRTPITSNPELPPGPKGAKLFNMLKQVSNFAQFMNELREKYGDIFYYRTPIINICILHDPKHIHEVFTARIPDPNRADAPPVMAFLKLEPPETKNLFLNDPQITLDASDDERYRRLLRLMGPGFRDEKFLEAHSVRIIENIQALHKRWKPRRTIHLKKEMTEFIAHCMIRLNLGTEVNTLHPSVMVDAMEGYKLDTVLCYMPGTPLLRILLLPWTRSSRHSVKQVDALIYRAIEQVHKSSRDSCCIASQMINANKKEEQEQLMDENELRDVLFENMTISIDPAAITLVRSFGHIAYYPEVRKRLEQEVDDVLGDRPIRVEDYDNLPYTRAIFQETLRLGPPAYVVNRTTREDYVLDGYLIPRKTNILCVLGGAHRDPRYWDNPDAFRPERWLEDPQPERPCHAYMPFGHETRVCTAKEFAMRAGVYLLANTAQRLRLDFVSGSPFEDTFNPYLLSVVKGPAPMTVTERKP